MIGGFSQTAAQNFPDYPERSDELLESSSAKNVELQPSEGIINPDEYKVGPGDNIFISISGVEETNLNLFVNPEGFLYIPQIGAVDLRNKTLSQSKKSIESKILKNYKNVELFITLTNFRKINVSLVGNVVKPSTYIVSSNSRLLDLIKSSKGLERKADIRNIKIISKDGSVGNFDYLKFLRTGDYSQNPFLNDGDVVIVDIVDKTVLIAGYVKYPATYEFVEGETVSDLLNLAGSVLFRAKTDSIEIAEFNSDGKSQKSKYYSLHEIQNSSIKLKHGDQVIIRGISDYYDDQWITIEGKIKHPGFYTIKKNKTTLYQIINEAGGFLEDASLADATIFRNSSDSSKDAEYERIKLIPRVDMTDDEYDYLKAKSRQQKGKVVVDFQSLFLKSDFDEDVILKKGDIINIPEKRNYISLIGQVVNPGNLVYNSEFKVQDYINLAGGFSWRAVEGDVRVIKANTGEWVDADDVEQLEPGDTIWILEDPPGAKFWDVFTTSLTILGQVATVVAATVAVIVATR